MGCYIGSAVRIPYAHTASACQGFIFWRRDGGERGGGGKEDLQAVKRGT
jgi:hypothetical protein